MSNNEVRLWGGWVSHIYGKGNTSEFFVHRSFVSSKGNDIPSRIRLVSPKTHNEIIFIKSEYIWFVPLNSQLWKDNYGEYINGEMQQYIEENGSMKLHLMMDR